MTHYSNFGEWSMAYIKNTIDMNNIGETVNMNELSYEVTNHDILFLQTLSFKIPLNLFEWVIDVYEKLTGPAEFMEPFPSGLTWLISSEEY